jgi:hypothetical protein
MSQASFERTATVVRKAVMRDAATLMHDEVLQLLIEYDEHIQSRMFSADDLGYNTNEYEQLGDTDRELFMAADDEEIASAASEFLDERLDSLIQALSSHIEASMVRLLKSREK